MDLISVVTKLLKESEFYGIQGMSRDEKEVIESLKVLTILVKTCKCHLSTQAVSNMFYSLKDMSSDKSSVLRPYCLLLVR